MKFNKAVALSNFIPFVQLYEKQHSSMGLSDVFQIVQMVPNCAKHHICEGPSELRNGS